jgi:hypothetical protein
VMAFAPMLIGGFASANPSNHRDWKCWVHDSQAKSESPPKTTKIRGFGEGYEEGRHEASLIFAEAAASYDEVYKNQL